mgnify:CR=1 FL=1
MDTPREEEIINEKPKKDVMLPASIIIAALLISGSWIYTTGVKNIPQLGAEAGQIAKKDTVSNATIKPVTQEDHVRGDFDAPIKIVEFSDVECPFCKQFHKTLIQVMSEYGNSGRVAWVYRHFPLDSLHPVKARKGAEASECANELGGNDAFWAFLDKYFEVTPSNNQFDTNQLPVIAEAIGLNRTAFMACLESGKYAQKIESQIQDAIAAGANGTPFSVMVNAQGETFPINGALPYTQIKSLVEQALK